MPAMRGGGRGDGAPYGVMATRHFQSGPPALLHNDEDGEVFETVQEEEVVHKRRKATTTTKNIERRTQRDLLLEDGRIVGDTGPTVTEDVTEDTQVKETFADENLKPEGQSDAVAALPPGEGWVAVPGSLITSEKVERYVNSHQEHEHSRETEQHAYHGTVTNDEVERYKGNVALLSQAAKERKAAAGKEVVLSEPRLVNETNRKWGVVDTEDIKETSRVKDGHVITETQRTTQQEQYDHGSAPDSGSSLSDGSVHEEGHKAAHHLVHTKDEDILEYYAVPRGGTLAQGVKLGEGMHVVSEDVQEDREGDNLDTLGASLLRHRVGPPPREDALTRKPLDYVKEERQRQDETTRWLEHHFGSDSGRSHESVEEAGGNRILITMSPHPASPPPTPTEGQLRRWGPLASTPNSNVRIVGSTPKPPSPPKSNSFSGPPPPPMPHQISEARSRLRSTGRTLDEIDSSRDVFNAGRVRDDSYNLNGSSTFTPPVSPTSPKSFNTSFSTDRYQPPEITKTRYQSHETNGRHQTSHSNDRYTKSPISNGRYKSFESNGRYEPSETVSNRYGKAETNETRNINVGRSQSFHSTAVERDEPREGEDNDNKEQSWKPSRSRSPEPAAPPRPKNRPLSGLFSTLQSSSKKKANRAAKIFDSHWLNKNDSGDKEDKQKARKNKKPSEKVDEDAKQYREKENDRPYSAMEASYSDRNEKNGSTHFSAKMANKFLRPQTSNGFSDSMNSETPVPPPRTKRRPRPQTTYYFGQQPEISTSSNKPRPNSIYANVNFTRETPLKSDYAYRDSGKFSTYQNRTNSSNGRLYDNDTRNDYDKKNPSRSRSESHNKTRYTDLEMNRRNESYNHRSDSRFSNVRDHSNDRYDSGYGERQDNYGHDYDRNHRQDDLYGRRSTDGRRHNEKPNRRMSEEQKHSSRRTSREKGSPGIERRFKTTKTITPVFVMESKQPKQYRSMDLLNSSPERNTSPDRNSSWNQTLEPRKKVSDSSRISSTLPRKVHQSTYTLPSKTYVYGHGDRGYTGGSMLNVTSDDSYQPNRDMYNSSINNKNVLRSQSLHVRPATNLSSLRSPNLIASIARSNSTRRPETQSSENLLSSDVYDRSETDPSLPQRYQGNSQTDEKKSRFMEGLLNTAPELFHFMHGDGEDTVDNKRRQDSPPRLMRPDSSSPSPVSGNNPPKVFTFGRENGAGGTLRRGSSGSGNELSSSITNLHNKNSFPNSRHSSGGYDSGTYSSNSLKARGHNPDGSRRQSAFNMKTEGGSLLYSPSFRERSQQMIKKRMQMQENAKMAGKRPGIADGDESPILIQVRDWNTR